VNNLTMDCMDRALRGGLDRETNLRYAMKGAAQTAQIITLLQNLRGQTGQAVKVETLNIESGANAVIGHVEAGPNGRRRKPGRVRHAPQQQPTSEKSESVSGGVNGRLA
jgi:hypothetical protein